MKKEAAEKNDFKCHHEALMLWSRLRSMSLLLTRASGEECDGLGEILGDMAIKAKELSNNIEKKFGYE